MTVAVAFALVLGLGLVVLPLVPALVELRRKTDAGPLVIGSGHGDCPGASRSAPRVQLIEGSTFGRLEASRIDFGLPSDTWEPGDPARASEDRPGPSTVERRSVRQLVEGDLEVPAGAVVEGSLVVMGRLRIGRRATLRGSVKSRLDLTLDDDVRVAGSVITDGSLVVGRGAAIDGPVLAGGDLAIGSGSRIGYLTRQTTVSAARIVIEPPAVVHGTAWARDSGVVARRP